MIPEIIIPSSKEHWLSLRKQDITSTEIGALFGISPYVTLYELWHRKSKNIDIEFGQNERMEWGNILEPVIAQEVARRNGWTVTPLKYYARVAGLRMGSSFDFSIDMVTGEDGVMVATSGILEIKNVDGLVYRNDWTETEAPLHIEIQVQHQLAVSGRKFAYICALVGGNELHIIRRERDESVIAKIVERVAEFWKSVADGVEPNPDFTKDCEFIARLHNYAEPEKVIDGTDDLKALAMEYKAVNEALKPLEEKKEELKARILMGIKDAEKVLGDGYTVSAGMVGECEVAYTRKAYRGFKVSFKKEKKA
jgi:putative phage-type endonuclease